MTIQPLDHPSRSAEPTALAIGLESHRSLALRHLAYRAPGAEARLARLSRAATDTAEGCRILARSSLDEAARSVVPNHRLRLEHSAATWAARATMLDRFDGRRLADVPAPETA